MIFPALVKCASKACIYATFLTLPRTRLLDSFAGFPLLIFLPFTLLQQLLRRMRMEWSCESRSGVFGTASVAHHSFVFFRRCGGGLTGFDSLGKNYSIVHVSVAYCAGFVYIQCITYIWAGYRPAFITSNLSLLLYLLLKCFMVSLRR